ncbi:MAG: TraR/DksA family transcriptional regulator [Actinomycetales bacterium]|nr:TraR/DksA family transcriptional regulator [Actinomycetales bacterium]
MFTTDRQAQLDAMRTRLEQQHETHTRQLAGLTEPSDDAAVSFTNAALAASSRRALAEIKRALRAMADGRYGLCEGCGREIPVERLEIRPDARFCVACQRTRKF